MADQTVFTLEEWRDKYWKLWFAIRFHHNQKADDRCIRDDDELYTVAGLPPCDRRVGDKFEMLKSCAWFIDKRCESGGWLSYAELERDRNYAVELIRRGMAITMQKQDLVSIEIHKVLSMILEQYEKLNKARMAAISPGPAAAPGPENHPEPH